jgi:hypothetical protein
VTSLEQKYAKLLFKLFDPRTNGGLADAQSGSGMAKVQMLGHGQCLNHGHQRYAKSQCRLGCRARRTISNGRGSPATHDDTSFNRTPAKSIAKYSSSSTFD